MDVEPPRRFRDEPLRDGYTVNVLAKRQPLKLEHRLCTNGIFALGWDRTSKRRSPARASPLGEKPRSLFGGCIPRLLQNYYGHSVPTTWAGWDSRPLVTGARLGCA